MPTTQVAVAIDALVTAFTAALPDVEIIDGQPQKLDAPDVLVVGFSADRVAAEITQEPSDLGGGRSETVSVVCLASSWRGETVTKTVRDRAVEILTAAQESLAADESLSGTVTEAELGLEMSLDQAQTADGATCTIEFTVRVVTL